MVDDKGLKRGKPATNIHYIEECMNNSNRAITTNLNREARA